MAPEKHALLSASAAHRWLNCPPSAQLCATLPDTTSEYAEEGTKAHAMCEYLLSKELGLPAERPEDCDDEVLTAAAGYRDFILDACYETETSCGEKPTVCVEQRVDFSRWAPEGFGTVDCLLIAGSRMHVFDFKYGKGVPVDAYWNPQMLCYALGALEMFGFVYEITDIDMTIYQPRLSNISTFSIRVEDLAQWAEAVLRPAALLAYNGEGKQTAGDWCRFCKAKVNCRAMAEQAAELARLDFPEPIGMSTAEICRILPKIDLLMDWCKSLKDYALDQAVAGSRVFPGWKVVEGRSNRKFRSEADACRKIKEAGFNPYITKMKGITELTKEMGSKKFEEICGAELYKPAGKPALVPESDKRPAMDLSAAADFAD